MKASDAQDFAKVKLKNYDRNEACKFLIDLESKGEVVGEEASSSSLFGQKCESLKLQSIPIPVDYAKNTYLFSVSGFLNEEKEVLKTPLYLSVYHNTKTNLEINLHERQTRLDVEVNNGDIFNALFHRRESKQLQAIAVNILWPGNKIENCISFYDSDLKAEAKFYSKQCMINSRLKLRNELQVSFTDKLFENLTGIQKMYGYAEVSKHKTLPSLNFLNDTLIIFNMEETGWFETLFEDRIKHLGFAIKLGVEKN